MEFTLNQIAEYLHGTVEGDGTATVHDVAKIEEGKAGQLCFLSNPKYNKYIYQTQATAVIVNADLVLEAPVDVNLIRVSEAYSAFAQLLGLYESTKPKKLGVNERADIAPSASIGKDVYIGAFVSIGDGAIIGDGAKIYANTVIGDRAKVGANSVLYANVSLYEDCVVGADCIVHAGAVIGSDGFGFAPQEDGSFKKIAQIGNVIVGDRVEIGANATLDRATMGATRINNGVKIDNLVQIAHNVIVGENTGIAAQTGVSGSAKIGKNCIIAGQVGVVGHIEIGDRVTIAAQSGVASSVKSGKVLLGSPAIDLVKQRRNIVLSRDMSALVKRIEELEKKCSN